MPPSGLAAAAANSGGRFPVSLAVKQNRIYVLNAAGEGNVTGFSVGRNGSLTPIPGSMRSLHTPTPDVGSQPDILRAPAQVEFSPEGDYLVITDKKVIVAPIGVTDEHEGVIATRPATMPEAAPREVA